MSSVTVRSKVVKKGKAKAVVKQKKPKQTGGGITEVEFPDLNKMIIAPEGSTNFFIVPYAPKEVTHSNLSSEWSEITRSGLDPLLVKSNDPRPHMSFQLFFGNPSDPDASIEATLKSFAALARNKKRLKIKYSTWEDNLWRISSLTMNSVQRNSLHQITQATYDVEFIMAADAAKHVGPASGGVKGGTKKKPQKYKVKKGDTLHKIAIKFYHDASLWKEIAKANKIKDARPKKSLKVGRVLKIPRIQSAGVGSSGSG